MIEKQHIDYTTITEFCSYCLHIPANVKISDSPIIIYIIITKALVITLPMPLASVNHHQYNLSYDFQASHVGKIFHRLGTAAGCLD